MSSLDRLRQILQSGPSPAAPRRELTYEPLNAYGDAVTPVRSLPELHGVRSVTTPFGEACVIERVAEACDYYGRVRVEECRGLDGEALRTLVGRPLAFESIDDSHTPVFVDLETTGLHGGAGTVAFLIGVGRFDDDGSFRTRQFFLPGFAGERAMLHAVAEAVADAPLVVTYNGGSFDLPIMETRWLFHRLMPVLEGRPHFDMLPPARRLWKESLNGDRSCRLVALEETLLGVRRVGDVGGFEIPGRYFEFVRTGDATPLEPVIEHNRLDILSLAVLMARALRLVRQGPAAAADARECVALGRVYERAGRLDGAEEAFRAAVAHAVNDRATGEQAWYGLARLLRKRRRYAEAAVAWRGLLNAAGRRGSRAAEAVEALAVHHEHRERNLVLARVLAQRALAQERDTRRQESIRHRVERLDRKLAALRAECPDGQDGVATLPWDPDDDSAS